MHTRAHVMLLAALGGCEGDLAKIGADSGGPWSDSPGDSDGVVIDTSETSKDCPDGIPAGPDGFDGFIETTFGGDGCVQDWTITSLESVEMESCPGCLWAYAVDVRHTGGDCGVSDYETVYGLEEAAGAYHMRYCDEAASCRMEVLALSCARMDYAGEDQWGSYVGWFAFVYAE